VLIQKFLTERLVEPSNPHYKVGSPITKKHSKLVEKTFHPPEVKAQLLELTVFDNLPTGQVQFFLSSPPT
jgi:hypothetical protein